MDQLPTTPGSIVTFDLPPDSDGSVYRAVATLIAGHIDEDGNTHDAVWASAEVQSPDDASCVFEPEVILASNPALHTLTQRAHATPDEIREDGTVIRVLEHDVWMTYTFAPSFIYKGELQEYFWTSSYGGYWQEDEDAELEVLFVPSHRA